MRSLSYLEFHAATAAPTHAADSRRRTRRTMGLCRQRRCRACSDNAHGKRVVSGTPSYCPVGPLGSHARNEGQTLGVIKYVTLGAAPRHWPVACRWLRGNAFLRALFLAPPVSVSWSPTASATVTHFTRYAGDMSKCAKGCAADARCKHFTACPGDGDKCFLKTGTSKVQGKSKAA